VCGLKFAEVQGGECLCANFACGSIQAILKKLPQTEEYPELIQQPSAAQTDW
jgi:hypothetical protein